MAHPAPSSKRPVKATRWNNEQYAVELSKEYAELSGRLVQQRQLPPAILKALKEGPDSQASAWLFDEMLKP